MRAFPFAASRLSPTGHPKRMRRRYAVDLRGSSKAVATAHAIKWSLLGTSVLFHGRQSSIATLCRILRPSCKRSPGQYYDSETGLLQSVFRNYDPAVGRYVESDPIGLIRALLERTPRLRRCGVTCCHGWRPHGRSGSGDRAAALLASAWEVASDKHLISLARSGTVPRHNSMI